jgi:hypothetical protein
MKLIRSWKRTLCRPSEWSIRLGYLTICNYNWWRFMWKQGHYYGLFRNKEGILPGRWGFFILGFEVGSRMPQDPIGVWLRNHGLWPW